MHGDLWLTFTGEKSSSLPLHVTLGKETLAQQISLLFTHKALARNTKNIRESNILFIVCNNHIFKLVICL